MKTSANYFNGKTSNSVKISLHLDESGSIRIELPEQVLNFDLTEVSFSSRLGNTPRSLTLPDGSSCQIADNNMVDVFLKQHSTGMPSIIHSLENNSVYVFTSIIFTAFFTWAMFAYGIPTMSSTIAYNLPTDVQQSLGQGTLKTLDELVFDPSRLDKATQNKLRDQFEMMQRNIDSKNNYRFVFRHSKKIGANAFALPSGIIVITDDLINISQHNDEIVSILAHELGHLVHHHSTRMAIQSSAIAVLIATITGDPFSTSSILVALPTVLINSSYSREFETEADNFAYDYMNNNNIDTAHFSNILERITQIDEDSDIESYISSHPETQKRILKFK